MTNDDAASTSGDGASGVEQVLAKLARELLESPLIGARARAAQAQEAAIGILGVPSAGDIDKLTRRVRSLSDRLTGIEDSLARIDGGLRRQSDQLAQRLEAIEKELAAATRRIADFESARFAGEPVSVSRNQEVLLRTSIGA
jgi:predicted  nucleic acid-binding Zn-ribbon protein